MSSEEDRYKHSRRRSKTKAKSRRQYKIVKDLDPGRVVKSEHVFAKRHAFNCGNPNCVMCGNPRKFFGHKTIQELRNEQSCLYDEDFDL